MPGSTARNSGRLSNQGSAAVQAPPWKMSRTPPRVKWACRPVGADNGAVYTRYLGLAPTELRDLARRGVI